MPYAFITGATGGIGCAAAQKLASLGYTVGIHTHSKPELAADIAARLGGDYYTADFSSDTEITCMAQKVLAAHSEIDILVNAAGISESGLFTDFTSEDTMKMFQINVLSMMTLTRAFLPSMIHKKRGKIINIASMWGETGASCEVDYSAAKGAVIAFTKALAKEAGPSGITVNAISPGVIKTDMLSCYSDEDMEALKEETPLRRIGTAKDTAAAVGFLASEGGDFITGEVIRVNGGFLI